LLPRTLRLACLCGRARVSWLPRSGGPSGDDAGGLAGAVAATIGVTLTLVRMCGERRPGVLLCLRVRHGRQGSAGFCRLLATCRREGDTARRADRERGKPH
jgi:hypothetical protein